MFKGLDRRRVIVFIVIVVAILTAIIGIWLLISKLNQPQNLYGNQTVSVKNLNNNTSDLPSNFQDSISNNLYNIVQLNLAPGQKMPATIDDAIIRSGSENQTKTDQNGLYIKSMVIDIPSLKQSYELTYEYSSSANVVATLTDIIIEVRCVDANQLIYGDFNCKNLAYQGEPNQDPILGILPYSTLDYQIQAFVDDNGKVSLTITLYPTAADYRAGVTTAITIYKQEALKWLENQGFDPNKYAISYTY